MYSLKFFTSVTVPENLVKNFLIKQHNPLGHAISELAKQLHSVPHLEKLYLEATRMGEEEVTALAHVLVYVPELDFLSLDKNSLGRGVRPQLTDPGLIKVQLTKKEATELCTLAIERNMYSFVIYI